MTRSDWKRTLSTCGASCLGVGIAYLGFYLFAGTSRLPAWQLAIAMVLATTLPTLLPESFHSRLKQPLSKGTVVIAGCLIGLAIVGLYVMFAQFP